MHFDEVSSEGSDEKGSAIIHEHIVEKLQHDNLPLFENFRLGKDFGTNLSIATPIMQNQEEIPKFHHQTPIESNYLAPVFSGREQLLQDHMHVHHLHHHRVHHLRN